MTQRLIRWTRPGVALAAVGLVALALSVGARAAEQQGGAVLPGGDSKEPIHIEAAKLDYFDKEQKLIYTGNVVATQGGSTLKSSVLVLYLTPKTDPDQAGVPSSSSQLRRMEATGPVTMITKDQVSTGDRGVYEKGENKLYLYDNVTVTQGTNVTKGDKMTYDLTTKKAIVSGRVKSMFLPETTAQKDNSAKSAAPKEDAAKPKKPKS
ncbi:LptA/OstA family protein [Methylocella silvestris]|uniref:Organic solvent tolerance protein OstA n=1 Tax=Methylocella silvestris TaxID=199596 RepID=A0A2J7TKG9_METSI|nr:LptA/OstA family protein [Methylocella silvestris]PNG27263.1 organic solvent tolerance protein OstA [Methylocella silvestris]